MNAQFHKLAPIIALRFMPNEFQRFLIADGYTTENLSNDADLPDEVDKDNITQNSEIHHAHSYKLESGDNGLHWIDGDALERLKGLCADAHDFKAENKLDMLRYTLAKMTHYRVDALTYPHLHKGKPWSNYHAKFEDNLGAFLIKNQSKIQEIVPNKYDDVYKACRKTAIKNWYDGLDYVGDLINDEKISDETKLEICTECIQGICDLWYTMSIDLKIIESR
ncbi:MAG: hypothetical protein Q8876_09790 [Bacillota bacterium]|nr:hypothetical protein [Bacillota bacterium]